MEPNSVCHVLEEYILESKCPPLVHEAQILKGDGYGFDSHTCEVEDSF